MHTGEREIKALEVKCNYQDRGCQWVGELGNLETHLLSCGYTLVRCTNKCKIDSHVTEVMKKDLQDHLTNKCPKRQYQCPHCKESGEHHERTTSHLEICPQFEVPCPNDECRLSIPRCEVSTHCSICDHEPISCKYAEVGCKKKPPRKDLKKHEEDDPFHLQILIGVVLKLKKRTANLSGKCDQIQKTQEQTKKSSHEQLERAAASLKEQLSQHLQALEHKNKKALEQMKEAIASQSRRLEHQVEAQKQESMTVNEKAKLLDEGVASLRMTVNEQSRTLDQFVGTLRAGVNELSRKLDQQVDRLGRELDQQAKLQKLTASLKNEYERMNSSVSSLNKKLKEQAETHDRTSKIALGVKQTNEIMRKKLDMHINKHEQSISELKQAIANQKREHDMQVKKQEQIKETFELSEFSTLKADKEEFHTLFYTSSRGYKMCVNVHANGYGAGKDTHVSVYASLMKGDNDHFLTWPFTGTVTLELLNQLEDKNHHKVCVRFQADGAHSRRVVGRGRERGEEWGVAKFVSHADLTYNRRNNCRYLKDDKLFFRVSVQVPDYKPWLECTL